jgi:UDP-galactopyranose mutase
LFGGKDSQDNGKINRGIFLTMNKKVLVLGGGVAGVSLAYFLHKKNYKVTIVEQKGKEVGGLSRTYYYGGHPYEFGPHVHFWPDPHFINDIIRELTDNKLIYIDRILHSYIEQDDSLYKYPIHFGDIKYMPECNKIMKELKINRDENLKLIPDRLPTIGQCTFEEYFVATIGKTLYNKFMKEYTHKMWNVPGYKLQTSMVWADILKHRYEDLSGYDPIKFAPHTLGSGLFQVYPKDGWNIVWEKMAFNAKNIKAKVVGINNSSEIILNNGDLLKLRDYKYVISTLHIDSLLYPYDKTHKLPYNGRLIIPFLVSGINGLPFNSESIYFSGAEPQTRVTDVDTITGYKGNSKLYLIEIPISDKVDKNIFPSNVFQDGLSKNLIALQAYAQQTKVALELHKNLIIESEKLFPNLLHCGRQAEFKYTSMPETINNSHKLVEEYF